jgi:hypothetical protein
MTFDLLNLTAFSIVFFALAALGVIVALASLTKFFTENHAARVRRHESIRSYYGHLALGH